MIPFMIVSIMLSKKKEILSSLITKYTKSWDFHLANAPVYLKAWFFFFLFFFTYTLIKFTCRDRLNFLILKLLKFVNQILLWSKERVHEVVTFFWKIKDFIMEESQRAHLALSFLSYKQQLEFITTLHIEVWVGMPLVVIYSLFFLVFFLYQ